MTNNTRVFVRWDVPPDYVYPNFADMIKDKEPNVSLHFRAKERTYPISDAHKIVLTSCSEYFEKSLKGDLKHYNRVLDYGKSAVFASVLRFMIRGKESMTLQRLQEFSYIAGIYALKPPSTDDFPISILDNTKLIVEYELFEGIYRYVTLNENVETDVILRCEEKDYPAHKRIIRMGSTVLAERVMKAESDVVEIVGCKYEMLCLLMGMMYYRRVAIQPMHIPSFCAQMMLFDVQPFMIEKEIDVGEAAAGPSILSQARDKAADVIQKFKRVGKWAKVRVKSMDEELPKLEKETQARVNVIKGVILEIGNRVEESATKLSSELADSAAQNATEAEVQDIVSSLTKVVEQTFTETEALAEVISRSVTPVESKSEPVSGCSSRRAAWAKSRSLSEEHAEADVLALGGVVSVLTAQAQGVVQGVLESREEPVRQSSSSMRNQLRTTTGRFRRILDECTPSCLLSKLNKHEDTP